MNPYEKIISSFPDLTIGVMGDMVADVYILGYPDRLSREAPVMVVRFEEERLIPGCAANSMNNLLALGCGIVPVSILGEDEYGRRLKEYFSKRDIPLDAVVSRSDFKTVSKQRIMVGEANRTKQQVIRIDREQNDQAPPGIEEEILHALAIADPRVDAWLVSDYDYHMMSPRIAEQLYMFTRNKPLVVDSRFRSRDFKGARCMTPNESEAMEAAKLPREKAGDMESLGRQLLKDFETESLVITRGNKGMIVFEKSGAVTRIPALGEDEVVDVTGAGDTVAAAITASLVAGATTVEAAKLASCAAGVVVMKTGAATCDVDELKDRIELLL